jgi:hypothetical protein
MGLCGLYYQFILSLVAAFQGNDWRSAYKTGAGECHALIQSIIWAQINLSAELPLTAEEVIWWYFPILDYPNKL